jgi:hypothetical protein
MKMRSISCAGVLHTADGFFGHSFLASYQTWCLYIR